jgi:hypothetical protein
MRLSSSTSGMWKRGMVWIVRHRQTKEPDTDRPNLNHRATSRLHHFRCRLGGSTQRKSLYPSSLGTVYRPFGRIRFSDSAVRGLVDATPVRSSGWRCATVSRLHRKGGRTDLSAARHPRHEQRSDFVVAVTGDLSFGRSARRAWSCSKGHKDRSRQHLPASSSVLRLRRTVWRTTGLLQQVCCQCASSTFDNHAPHPTYRVC